MYFKKIASLGNNINSAFAVNLFFFKKLFIWKFQGKNLHLSLPFVSTNSSGPTMELLSTETIQYHKGSRWSLKSNYCTSHFYPMNCVSLLSHLLILKPRCCLSHCLDLLFQTEHVWTDHRLLPKEQPLSAVARH